MTGPYRTETLVLGLSLIGLGIVWTLGNMGRLDLLYTLRTWWPLSLILWGLLELGSALVRRRDQTRRTR